MAPTVSDQRRPSTQRGRGCGRVWGLFAGLLALVILLAGLSAVLLLARLRQTAPDRAVGPRVQIRLPSPGSRLRMDNGQAVVIQTSTDEGVGRFELWVDGGLARIQVPSNPADGLETAPIMPSGQKGNALAGVAEIPWRVGPPGAHILVARVYDAQGRMGQSRPVVVEAVGSSPVSAVTLALQARQGDTLESLAERWGTTPEEAIGANPGLTAPLQPGDQVILPVPPDHLPPGFPAEDGSRHEGGGDPRPGDQPMPNLLTGGRPLAPGMPSLGSLGDCQISLSWSIVEQAQTYRIYRFGGPFPDFEMVGEVGGDQTTFVDRAPLGGAFEYYLAASNREGETAGPLANLDVPAADCADQAELDAEKVYLQFAATELVTSEPFDKAYCYVSVAEEAQPFDRLPRGEDSFLISADGKTWDLGGSASGIHRTVFGHRSLQPVPVRTECWGWRGEDLLPLGSFLDQRPRADWGKDLTGAGAGFQLRYRLEPYTNDQPLDNLLIEDVGIESPYRVRIAANQPECLAHTDEAYVSLEAQREAWAGVWACLGVDPEQMLIWEWNESAEVRRSDLNGYRIFVNRNWPADADRPAEDGWEYWGEVGPATQAYPILPTPCGRQYGYRMVAFISGGLASRQGASGQGGAGFVPPVPGPGDGQIPLLPSESPPSGSSLPILGPECPAGQVVVDIELDSIQVGHTWDEFCLFEENLSCEDEELEVYGWGTFFLHSADGSIQELADIEFWQDIGCGFGCGNVGWATVNHDSDVRLGEEDLTLCISGEACHGPGPGNNWIQASLGEGDNIEFAFILWDQDDDSGDDIWCGTSDDQHTELGLGPAELGTATKPLIVFDAFHPDQWPPMTERTGSWDNDGLDYQDSECTLNISVRSIETR